MASSLCVESVKRWFIEDAPREKVRILIHELCTCLHWFREELERCCAEALASQKEALDAYQKQTISAKEALQKQTIAAKEALQKVQDREIAVQEAQQELANVRRDIAAKAQQDLDNSEKAAKEKAQLEQEMNEMRQKAISSDPIVPIVPIVPEVLICLRLSCTWLHLSSFVLYMASFVFVCLVHGFICLRSSQA
jgi:hypothetical protein